MSTSMIRKTRTRLAEIRSWVVGHKVLTCGIAMLVVIIAAFGLYQYNAYSQKFSQSDYDRLASMAETVLKNSGGKDIQTSKTCSYERPSEFASLHLYCRIAMVTYLPYVSDEQAVMVGKTLNSNVSRVGKLLISPVGFYARPSNNEWTLPTNLIQPYPTVQCNFEIATKDAVGVIGLGLPKNETPNLIALGFYCAHESRAEYFPVTYRQG